MKNDPKSAPVVFWLVLSLLFVIAINLTVGTYFEDAEILYDQFMTEHFAGRQDYNPLLVNTHFGTIGLLNRLAVSWERVPVYSTVMSAYNVLALFFMVLFFVGFVRNSDIRPVWRVVLIVCLFAVLADAVMYVNNVKTSLLFCSAAFLWLNLISDRNLGPIYYLIVGTGFLASLSIRYEMALIISVLGVAYALMFGKRRVILTSLGFLFISLTVLTVSRTLQKKTLPEVRAAHIAEHEFYDRNNIDLNPEDLQEFLRRSAMKMFIVDAEQYTITDYKDVLKQDSLPAYIISRGFLDGYKTRLQDLWRGLEYYRWLVRLFAVLVVFVLLNAAMNFRLEPRFYTRVLLFTGVCLAVPLLLNAALLVPLRFFTTYMVLMSLLAAVFVIRDVHRVRYTRWMIVVLVLSGGLSIPKIAAHERWSREQQKLDLAREFHNCQEQAFTQEKTIVVSNFRGFGLYPTKLFITTKERNIRHYYLDMFFYSVYDYYKKVHIPFFGPGYTSLKQRILKCADDKDIVFISDESYNYFLENYLRELYGLTIYFERTDCLVSESYNSYRIHTDTASIPDGPGSDH